jgi:hypothetical protein
MTKLLSEAFERVSRLPEEAQDELANALLDVIRWEASWPQRRKEATARPSQEDGQTAQA